MQVDLPFAQSVIAAGADLKYRSTKTDHLCSFKQQVQQKAKKIHFYSKASTLYFSLLFCFTHFYIFTSIMYRIFSLINTRSILNVLLP